MARFADRPERLTGLTLYLLSQAAMIVKRELDARLAERGLRVRHMAVLAALDEGPTTQLELTRRLDLDPSDLTATIDDLEAARLVRRTADQSDRRRKVVTLTRSGSRELGRLELIGRQLADTVLAPLPERRRQQLHQDLRRILVAHDDELAPPADVD